MHVEWSAALNLRSLGAREPGCLKWTNCTFKIVMVARRMRNAALNFHMYRPNVQDVACTKILINTSITMSTPNFYYPV